MNHIAHARGIVVGHGIAARIYALAAEPDAESEEGWIHFCITAADEAYEAIMRDPPQTEDARGEGLRMLEELIRDDGDEEPERERLSGEALEIAATLAASTAFRMNMPPLTGRRRAKAYLACVAVGVQRGYLTGNEAKALLYVAQLALTANPKRQQRRGNGGRHA